MKKLKDKAKEKLGFTSVEAYKFYKKTHPNPVNQQTYAKVIKTLNKKCIDLIYNGLVLNVPANLGFIGITESKTTVVFTDEGEIDMKKSSISTDWCRTNKLWREKPELKHKKYIFYDNSHTGGRRFVIKWNRKYVASVALPNYAFIPTRAFKRNLTQYIYKHPNKEYYDF